MSAHQSGDEISSDDNNGQATFHDEAQNGNESEEMEDITDYNFLPTKIAAQQQFLWVESYSRLLFNHSFIQKS